MKYLTISLVLLSFELTFSTEHTLNNIQAIEEDDKDSREFYRPFTNAHALQFLQPYFEENIDIPDAPILPELNVDGLPKYIRSAIAIERPERRRPQIVKRSDQKSSDLNKTVNFVQTPQAPPSNNEQERHAPRTYGLNLTDGKGYVWNDLNKNPGVYYEVSKPEDGEIQGNKGEAYPEIQEPNLTANPNAQNIENLQENANIQYIKESKANEDLGDIEVPYKTINVSNKNTENLEEDGHKIPKPSANGKGSKKPTTFNNLLNDDHFWKWLSQWTEFYFDVHAKNIERQIKEEVAKQLSSRPHGENESDKNKIENRNENSINININTDKTEQSNAPKDIKIYINGNEIVTNASEITNKNESQNIKLPENDKEYDNKNSSLEEANNNPINININTDKTEQSNAPKDIKIYINGNEIVTNASEITNKNESQNIKLPENDKEYDNKNSSLEEANNNPINININTDKTEQSNAPKDIKIYINGNEIVTNASEITNKNESQNIKLPENDKEYDNKNSSLEEANNNPINIIIKSDGKENGPQNNAEDIKIFINGREFAANASELENNKDVKGNRDVATNASDSGLIDPTKDRLQKYKPGNNEQNNSGQPINVDGETIYGNSIGNDQVTNIFIFYPKENDDIIKGLIYNNTKNKNEKNSSPQAALNLTENVRERYEKYIKINETSPITDIDIRTGKD